MHEFVREIIDATGTALEYLPEAGEPYWPARFVVDAGGVRHEVALYLSRVRDMARAGAATSLDEAHETRILAKAGGHAPAERPGTTSLIAGIVLRDSSPSLMGGVMAIPGDRRLGNASRFSVITSRQGLIDARRDGFATWQSSSGEPFVAFRTELLPAVLTQIASGTSVGSVVIDGAAAAATAALPLPAQTDTARQRERRQRLVDQAVRDSRFRDRVFGAWGPTCQACGIDDPRCLHAAHILDVADPTSTDDVENGFPLCLIHHQLFDRHALLLDPDDLRIEWQVAPAPTSSHRLEALHDGIPVTLTIPASIDRDTVARWAQLRHDRRAGS